MKYQTALSSESRPSVGVSHNALALLMSSARSIATADMAQRVEHNSKDRLYNDTLKFLEVCSIKCSSGTKTSVEKLVHTLMEIVWYIDGHHHLLSERSTVSVPSMFKQFQGYNKPELSKHRKRSQSNLSSITLEHHARTLASCILGYSIMETVQNRCGSAS